MPAADVVVLTLLVMALRECRLGLLWRLPHLRGSGWLFDARVEPDAPARGRIVARYRAWLLGTALAVEAAALADLLLWGSLAHLVFVQGPLTLALALARRAILRVHVLGARDIGAAAADARVALSLRPRRLADFTHAGFETANAVATAAAFGLLLRSGAADLPLALLLAWCQLGGLLWKAALARYPVPLPATGSSEYLELAEAAFREGARRLDQMRGACTFVLALLAAKAAAPDAFARHSGSLARALLAALAVAVVLLLVKGGRSSRALLARAAAVPGRAPRPRRADPSRLLCAGLFCWNPEEPAVLVDGGPLRSAINLVHPTAWLALGWWLGFALLIVAIGVRA